MVTEAELLKQIETRTGIEKLKALLHYSNFMRQSDWQKSLESARQAEALAVSMKEADYEIEALVCEAYAYYYHSDFKESRRLSDRIYILLEARFRHIT